jgi:hypothetical protein
VKEDKTCVLGGDFEVHGAAVQHQVAKAGGTGVLMMFAGDAYFPCKGDDQRKAIFLILGEPKNPSIGEVFRRFKSFDARMDNKFVAQAWSAAVKPQIKHMLGSFDQLKIERVVSVILSARESSRIK